MKTTLFLLLSYCGLVAKPYLQEFTKPILLQEVRTFDRTQLIPIAKGEHQFSDELPAKPQTIEHVVTAGNITANNESFVTKKLSADNVIPYLKDSKHKTQGIHINDINVDIHPIRKIQP